MNERIKELMIQANKDIPLGKDFWPALEQFSEKFAELIVRECVLEAMDAIHHDTSIRIQLYEHFGVKQ